MSGEKPGPGATDGARIRPAQFAPPGPGRPRRHFRADPKLVAAAAVFAVFVLVIWFLIVARSVSVITTPPEAEIDISSLLHLRIGAHHLLLPGEHEFALSAEGHEPLREAIQVGPDNGQQFEFKLQRLPGHLVVDAGAVEGARVIVDGEPRGSAPMTVRGLAHGEHVLEVTADLYFPHKETVVIEGMDREQKVNVALEPAWADVRVASNPEQAEILVDDAPVGRTPATVRVPEGERSLRVRHAGFKDWERTLHVVAGEAMEFPDVALEPAEAVVFLASEPPGAGTTVNGEYRGLTPLELALAPGRPNVIRLFKQGYQSATREVSVKSGDNSRLSVALQPELGPVEVRVSPADAEIYVDGVRRATGSQVLQLTALRHTVEVRREGYVSRKQEVTPHAGLPQLVRFELMSEAQAKAAAVQDLIETPDGQSLKLFRPGEFSMGASRREPGRRANETLRTVKLQRPFYLGTREVTNGQFRKFLAAHSSGRVESHSLDGETQPVVQVTWDQAAQFCNWLSQSASLPGFYKVEGGQVTGFNRAATGYRLPTEAEWEWAARVAGSGTQLKFPWPGEMPPPKGSGNFADETAGGIVGMVLYKYDDGFTVTAPPGSFPAGPNGLYDMGGNAAEWVNDFYDVAAVDPASETDPLGPPRGEFHVIRGSSWAHGSVTELRLSYRDYGKDVRPDLGFRIARYLE